eukprot:g2946.t1
MCSILPALLLFCSANVGSTHSSDSNGTRLLDGAHFLGFNVVNLQSGNFSSDAEYVRSTAGALQAGILRYPGGNLADFWDWRRGWCVENATAASCPECRNPCSGKSVPRRYSLEEFAIALNASSARPVFMLNMLTANLTEGLAMLEHARAIGLLRHGAYAELGGEAYWGKYSGRWASGASYAVEANEWAHAIRSRFNSAAAGDVKVLAVAAHSIANKDPADRGYLWNKLLYANLDTGVIHGVSMHPYLHLGDDTTGEGPLQPGVGPRAKGEGPTGWSANASVQQSNLDLLRSPLGAEGLLGVPFFVATSASGNAATHFPLPAPLRLVITEYNVMERAGPLKLTWLHALFTVATALNLLSIRQVEGVLLHVLLNGYGWGALYETDADFAGPFGGQPPPGSAATAVGQAGCLVDACSSLVTAPYAPTAVGTALGALSSSMRGANRATALELGAGTPTNPLRVAGRMPSGLPGSVSYPALIAWRFDADTGDLAKAALQAPSNITVLNLSPAALPLPHGAVGCGCVTARSWTTPDAAGGSPMAWATSHSPVRQQAEACANLAKSPVILPGYSITIVSLRACE